MELELTNGTDQGWGLTHEVGKSHAHEDGGHTPAQVTLPGLFGAQLDEGSPAEEEPEHVGHDVVDDHHHDGKDEVDQALEQVLNDQVGLGHHDEQSHVGPGEEGKLKCECHQFSFFVSLS